MNNSIIPLEQINIDNLKLKHKLKLSNNYEIIPLQYNNQDFIFQTPKMSLPFGVTTFNNQEYFKMSFSNKSNDPRLTFFLSLINNLNVYLNKCIFCEILDNKTYTFLNPLDKYKNFPYMLSTKIFNNSSENLLIFDHYKNNLLLEEIKKNDYCKSILYISNIWIHHHNRRWGYDIYVLQLKIYTIYRKLTEYAFIEDTEDLHLLGSRKTKSQETLKSESNLIKIESHPKYKKYFKMLSFGVPKENIRSQMKIDGVDSNYIEHSPDYLISCNQDSLKSKTAFNVHDLLQNKSNLRKMTVNSTPSKKKEKHNKSIFSLEDILRRIKNLKKTNINLT